MDNIVYYYRRYFNRSMFSKSFTMSKEIADRVLLGSTLGHLPDFEFQVYRLPLLQIMDLVPGAECKLIVNGIDN